MKDEDELKNMMDDLEKYSYGSNYFLNDDKTYRLCTLREWVKQFELIDNRRVGYDYINECEVSTVWLGIDHNYIYNGPPILFETMVFLDGISNIYQERYSTWQEAEEGHQRAIQWVKNGCKEDNL